MAKNETTAKKVVKKEIAKYKKEDERSDKREHNKMMREDDRKDKQMLALKKKPKGKK